MTKMKKKVKKGTFPFDVEKFEKENKVLISKYKRKKTRNINVPEFENINDSWYHSNNENLLRGRLKLEEEFSVLQKLEWIKCRDNIIYFIEKYVQIISIDDGVIPFIMYDYQKELIELYNGNRFVISTQARQSGKCVRNDTKIKIKNKYTHEVKEINIGDFHELIKNKTKD